MILPCCLKKISWLRSNCEYHFFRYPPELNCLILHAQYACELHGEWPIAAKPSTFRRTFPLPFDWEETPARLSPDVAA